MNPRSMLRARADDGATALGPAQINNLTASLHLGFALDQCRSGN
jgi:hypothetical protein